MSFDVLCLRPEADFTRVGVAPPTGITVAYRRPDDVELAALIKAARALVIPAVGGKLSGSLFEGGQVKLVQVTGAGVDRLDEAAMKKLGIAVANVPGGSNSAVAEYAVGCAILLLRRLAWSDREIREASYVSFRGRMIADNLPGLEGLTVGVVGMGTVGLAVAEAFHRFGCQIVYHDPAPRDGAAAGKIGAKAVSLDDLLKTSDVVTLHVPLLPQTRSMIGARQLNLMKPGAVLIQASRGGVVNEVALAARYRQSAVRSRGRGGPSCAVHAPCRGRHPPVLGHPLSRSMGQRRARPAKGRTAPEPCLLKQPPMNADERQRKNETPRRKAAKAQRRASLNIKRAALRLSSSFASSVLTLILSGFIGVHRQQF
jgi:phosphoglycerate dehydrogenase-like enzyme